MKFEEYFNKNIKTLKNFIENPHKFFDNYRGNDFYEKLIYLKEYIDIFKSKSFNKCLIFGIKLFYLNIKKNIDDILTINPLEKFLKDGNKFWKGSNRLPHSIEFNAEDDMNFFYINYFSYLLAYSLRIPINTDMNYKKQILKLNKINENENIFESDLEQQRQKLEKLKSELLKL